MTAQVAFRFDATASIGYGHLTRCLAIAEELRVSGYSCVAVTRTSPSIQIDHVTIPTDVPIGDEGAFIAESIAPVVLVADLCGATAGHISALCRGGRLVRIEDEATAPPSSCSLLINPSFGALPDAVIAAADSYFGGPAALILRRQFRSLPAYEVRDAVRTAAVCFGGSDPVNATSAVVAALRNSSLDRINVIVGPGFQWSAELATQIGEDPRFTVARAVDDMVTLLRNADVGVLAAGTLLYEALAVGLPSIFVSITASQEREARHAAEMGAAFHLGGPEQARRGLNALLAKLADADVREPMSARAQQIVDGQGCARVAARIADVVKQS